MDAYIVIAEKSPVPGTAITENLKTVNALPKGPLLFMNPIW